MLKLEPGREEEALYWLANLRVNAAVMRAIAADDRDVSPPCDARPQARAGWRRLMPRPKHR